MRVLIPSLLLIASSLAAADSAAGDVTYLNHRALALSLTNVDDPARVASAALFLTSDGGQTWKLAQEVAAPADHKQFPRFSVTLPSDGAFGLASRTVFSNGQREADPQPGMPPAVTVIVDTQAPVFAGAQVTLVNQRAGLADVHARWTVTDAHLGESPVTIETAGGDGRFSPQGTGASSGVLDATVAVNASSTLFVRFVAKDLAGNVTTSATTSLRLAPPPLDAASRQALAEAIETLPSSSLAASPVTKPVIKPVAPVQPPAPLPAPAVVDSPAESVVPLPPTDAVGAEPRVPLPPVTVVEAPKPPIPPPVVDGKLAPPVRRPFVTGSEADDLIRDARVAVQCNQVNDALEFYERAISSSRVGDAAKDVTRLLVRLQRPTDLCTFLAAVPGDFLDDQTRLIYGRTLLSLGRHQEAENTVAGIGSKSPEAREAKLLIARCWLRAGRTADARVILSKLAQGTDGVAAEAREIGR